MKGSAFYETKTLLDIHKDRFMNFLLDGVLNYQKIYNIKADNVSSFCMEIA